MLHERVHISHKLKMRELFKLFYIYHMKIMLEYGTTRLVNNGEIEGEIQIT